MNRLLVTLLVFAFIAAPAWAARKAEHVFIVSFDGGKPSVMQESKMPQLKSLADKGAFTWKAQTVFPSLTLTSHTSMLTGVGPEKHKALWNEWEPNRGIISTPTIFSLAKAQDPKISTAMFVGKPKFMHLAQDNSLNNFSLPSYHCEDVATLSSRWIKERKPNLCFIHFADSDSAGHMYGWGSPQQKQSFIDEDNALKSIVKAIDEAGIADTSVVIMTADHGGHEHTHGTNSPEDMNIPWIVWGHGVKKSFPINARVTTCDTAATALWLLDVPLPANFDGKPVTGAFDFPVETSNANAPVATH